MEPIRITAPLDAETARSLRAGDRVLLSGTVYTCLLYTSSRRSYSCLLALILTPGPMVEAVTQLLIYWPLAAAGLALSLIHIFAVLAADPYLQAARLSVAEIRAAAHLKVLALPRAPGLDIAALHLQVRQIARAALQLPHGDVQAPEQVHRVVPCLLYTSCGRPGHVQTGPGRGALHAVLGGL